MDKFVVLVYLLKGLLKKRLAKLRLLDYVCVDAFMARLRRTIMWTRLLTRRV